MRAAAQRPTSAEPIGPDLRRVLGKAHEAAIELLNDSDGARLDVVAWLSAHIAAFEHAVYPVAKRRLADGAALLDEDRNVVARLSRALRITERLHSGDILARNLSAQRLRERLTDLVAEQQAIQQRMVDSLERTLDQDSIAKLSADYTDALAHAPTRPHPHLRSGLMFRLDALRDRILDTMDGRHVPVPRIPRRQITPGRWGSYLLGHQQLPADGADEPQPPA